MNIKMKMFLATVLAVGGLGLVSASTLAATTSTLDLPVTKNPILNSSKIKGLLILKTWVQDNTDPSTGAAIADRLQMKLSNTTSSRISNLEIFYTMTDTVTKSSESYYKKLVGFDLAAKSAKYIYFDNSKGIGHFSENQYSLYRHSNNVVSFKIEVSAKGFAPQYSKATKAKGTTENPNG